MRTQGACARSGGQFELFGAVNLFPRYPLRQATTGQCLSLLLQGHELTREKFGGTGNMRLDEVIRTLKRKGWPIQKVKVGHTPGTRRVEYKFFIESHLIKMMAGREDDG